MRNNEVLLLKGPASLQVIAGEATSLGSQLVKGRNFIVRKGKMLPIETMSIARISIHVANGGRYFIRNGEVGTKMWRKVGARICNSGTPLHILIIGTPDSGKSTLAAYLLNVILNVNEYAGIIDGDIGQGDICPPGSIGGAIVKLPLLDLREVKAEHFRFIGATSPHGLENQIADELEHLVRSLMKTFSGNLIINTDGYIKNGGREYKLDLIRRLRPDLVICLDLDPEFQSEISKTSSEIVVINRAEYLNKTYVERRQRRFLQYHRFLKVGRNITIDLSKYEINLFAKTFCHSHIDDLENGRSLTLFGKNGDKLNISRDVKESLEIRYSKVSTFILSTCLLPRMFVGLGTEEEIRSFGIIQRYLSNNKLTIFTPSLCKSSNLFLSTIRLSDDFNKETTIPITRNYA